MPIDPKSAKKMGQELNTQNLNQLIEQSDEIMRMIMEAGNMEMAEMAAQISAQASAALIARKQGVRDLAKRVRERVSEDEPEEGANPEAAAPAAPEAEAKPEPEEPKSE
jgi:hypothetical protein